MLAHVNIHLTHCQTQKCSLSQSFDVIIAGFQGGCITAEKNATVNRALMGLPAVRGINKHFPRYVEQGSMPPLEVTT